MKSANTQKHRDNINDVTRSEIGNNKQKHTEIKTELRMPRGQFQQRRYMRQNELDIPRRRFGPRRDMTNEKIIPRREAMRPRNQREYINIDTRERPVTERYSNGLAYRTKDSQMNKKASAYKYARKPSTNSNKKTRSIFSRTKSKIASYFQKPRTKTRKEKEQRISGTHDTPKLNRFRNRMSDVQRRLFAESTGSNESLNLSWKGTSVRSPSSEREATRLSKINEGSRHKHIARSSLSDASRDASQRSDESGTPINGSQRQGTPLTLSLIHI